MSDTKPKIGRPFADKPATAKLPNVRMQDHELQIIKDAAKILDKSLSSHVRDTVLKASNRIIKNDEQ